MILIDRLRGNPPPPPPIDDKGKQAASTDTYRTIDSVRQLRLGVTPKVPEFDNMAKLLDTLGDGYPYEMFPLNDLRYPEKLKRYDVIFLTCSGVAPEWVDHIVGSAERNMRAVIVKPDVMEEVEKGLREFVGKGGTLYASDFHYGLVSRAFPAFAGSDNVVRGKAQKVTASVVDTPLRELIGSELPLTFDQPSWRPAAFSGDKVTVFLRAPYETEDGEKKESPLLVSFPYQEGAVIFTSFHNEAVNSEIEAKLLKFVVFTAVTKKVETRIDNKMVQLGFSPAKKGLFSTSKSEPSVAQIYKCPGPASLQFVLGFSERVRPAETDGQRPGRQNLRKRGNLDLCRRRSPGEGGAV